MPQFSSGRIFAFVSSLPIGRSTTAIGTPLASCAFDMFSGIHCVLSKVVQGKREEILKRQLLENGAVILETPPSQPKQQKLAPLFMKSTSKKRKLEDGRASPVAEAGLPQGLTHIFVETKEKSFDAASLLRDLGIDDAEKAAGIALQSVQVVSSEWIVQCAKAKKQVEVERYLLVVEPEKGAKLSASSSTADAGEEIVSNGAASGDVHDSGGKSSKGSAGSSSGGKADITYEDTEGSGAWEAVGGGAVSRFVPTRRRHSSHIAAFDMDGTIIVTKSGKKFAEDFKDWKLLFPKVIPTKLQSLHEQGYKVVIISNQGGVEASHTTAKDVQKKVQQILQVLGVPVEVYLVTEKGLCRKPAPGVWSLMQADAPIAADLSKCFYVGDAAGRPAEGKTRKKDFSASDLKFAMNVGIDFQTPEQFFLGSKIPLHCDRQKAVLGFNPETFRATALQAAPTPYPLPADGKPELVVLVGPPAAGKSTLCVTRFPEHVRVNQDTLKTLKACQKAASAALEAGKSVVIDSTNRNAAGRRDWVSLAHQHGATARCVHVLLSKDQCFHLNTYRGVSGCWAASSSANGAADHRVIDKVVIHTYYKYVEAPSMEEGFDALEQLDFVAGPFPNEDAEQLFYKFLL